ncbi:peptidylprolyl isomerase [Lamprobacter modestohalophilus]|uniref:Peptidyl-prolyl cis-trans isomerase n=1 Tax=Lamprobacter modestohalophilus TaxID=1064514 RepID=A0A9X1B5Z5_9GAMM|nr:peptidylprolyl isomerase [Lamprobacter modestohalophilus]MCF7978976.1 peptidylprolyl isomerase [Chromatiaceae bacterium]MBK1620371.1 peptidylprolyl isomerase [Lamprobacter modestohalophilus]MCF7995557.1 peptidylprolyl isomerase [Chromatiaceae bacterium]MCF8004820.1 peptidylprolyl isomerase [Chromatiaceae bacterium]MCF8017033.1 peptidylprolyl isomerase [Chromatiaceae bacterium]
MTEAKSGDTVKVHYTGTLTDGTEFDSSRGQEPLEFTLGQGQMISGFEEAVVGMTLGENKTITIASGEAYGERNESMVQQVPRTAIPPEIKLAQGMLLQAQGPDGETLQFTVADFNDEEVTVDGNHPLAGRDLTFQLELVQIAE